MQRYNKKVESGERKEEKVEKLHFFINFPLKILSIQEKALPLHPQLKEQGCSGWQIDIGVWCNGNTTDSGPVILGSSPSTPTEEIAKSL